MKPANEEEMDSIMITEQEKFILQLVLNHFSFNQMLIGLESIVSNAEMVKSNLPEFRSLLAQLKKSVIDLMALSERFQNQVKNLHKKSGFKEQQALQERIESAVVYFTREINVLLLNHVNKNIRIKPKNKAEQQIQSLFQKYRQVIENKINLLQFAAGLLKEPIKTEDYTAWISRHKSQLLTKTNSSSGNQQAANNLQLF
jgi:ATP-dependent DNA helicase PIF1